MVSGACFLHAYCLMQAIGRSTGQSAWNCVKERKAHHAWLHERNNNKCALFAKFQYICCGNKGCNTETIKLWDHSSRRF